MVQRPIQIARFSAMFVLLLGATANAAVGRIDGAGDVSPGGEATYTIPLTIPAGINGLTPELSLVYGHRQSEGLAGVGWGLAGLSQITRCAKSVAQDGVTANVELKTTDRFCVDGVQLKLTAGTYGSSGSQYRSEIDTITRYTALGQVGDGPSSFTAKAKNGLLYEYGNTTNSRIESLALNDTSTVLTWALNKIVDPYGNEIVFTYEEDGAPYGAYRIDNITYRSNPGQGVAAGYLINFTYETQPAQDKDQSYAAGGTVEDTKRLDRIDIWNLDAAPDVLVRGYELTYESTLSPSNRSRLESLTECAGSALECLPSTTFSYQDGATGFDTEWTPSSLPAGVPVRVMDVNGDGRSDLVYPSSTGSGTWHYQLANGSGFGAVQNTNITNANYSEAIIIDHNHDGRDDLLVPLSGNTWWAIHGTASGMSGTAINTSAPDVSSAGNAAALDVNGDGRDDLIWGENIGQSSNSKILVRYRQTSGNTFSSTTETVFDGGTGGSQLAGPTLFGTGAYQQDRNRKFDANGDGRDDIAVINKITTPGGPGEPPETFYFTRVYLAGGGMFTSASDSTVGLPIDINGDGYTDIAYQKQGNTTLRFKLSTGQNFSTEIAGQSLVGYNISGSVVTDWNQDGRQDLLIPNTTVGAWYYFESLGDSFATGVTTGKATNGATYGFLADAEGDALGDFAFVQATDGKLRVQRHGGGQADLLDTVTDGNGNTTKFNYTSIAESNYTKGTGATFPNQDYSRPLVVVKTLVRSTGVDSNTYTFTFTYQNLLRSLDGRGLATFGRRTIVDGRNGSRSAEYYYTEFPYRGRLSRVLRSQQDNTKIQDTTYTWSTKNAGSGIQKYYFPYISESIEKNYEVGGSYNGAYLTKVVTTTEVDSYGTPTSIEKVTTEQSGANGLQAGVSFTESIVNSNIVNATMGWCLGQVGQTQWINSHSAAYGTQITRTLTRTWNSSYCHVDQEITEPSSSKYKVTKAIGHDAFGNVNSETITGIGMPARTVSMYWGTNGQFPQTVTNPLNQTTTLNWNATHALLSSQTDPNGLTVSWLYDNFGRKTRQTLPDATYTTFTLTACNSGNNRCGTGYSRVATEIKASAKMTTGVEIRADYNYLDKADRLVQNERQLVSGALSRTRTVYDAYGRVSQQSMPSFAAAPAYFSTISYDLLGRPTELARPSSAANTTLQSTTIDYWGLVTRTTDANDKHSDKTIDALGRVYRSTDHNGYYQQFGYDAFGSLRNVGDSVNTLYSATYDYGVAPMRESSFDMDMGSWTYNPNALGEVVGHTDAKSQSFTATYDKLSRPLTRVEPGVTTTWVWGNSAASKNIGRLQSVAVAGHSKAYAYDGYGRLSQITTVADATYAFNYGYDSATGLLDFMTYPISTSGYRLKLKYDYGYGIVKKVSDYIAASTVFWEVQSVDARGNTMHEAMGTSLESIRSYDEVTGRIDYAIGGPNANGFRQNLAFTWDKVGNLTERDDLKRSHTENYYYDNLHRLDYSELDGVQNLDVAYDAMGNITSKSDVGSGTWTYHGSKKHAVTAAPGFTFTYDANGNQVKRNSDDITWTSYNYPAVIENGSKSHSYFYDGDRARWKSIYNDGTSTETTIEIGNAQFGNALEKRTEGSYAEYRHYIHVDGKAVALYTRPNSGSPVTKFFLYDHQGNLDAVTNATGQNYLSLGYSAFGKRRDAWDYTGNPPPGDITNIDATTPHGYTFHAQLEESSLIHMNGRVMDGLTGRFLSPDPYTFNAGNTQSFNRYSYVYNNPQSNWDPSGFECFSVESCLAKVLFSTIGAFFFDALFGGGRDVPPPEGCFVPNASSCYGKAVAPHLLLTAVDVHILPLSEVGPIEGNVLRGGFFYIIDGATFGAWDYIKIRSLQKSIQTEVDIESFEIAIGRTGQIAAIVVGFRKEIVDGLVTGVSRLVRRSDGRAIDAPPETPWPDATGRLHDYEIPDHVPQTWTPGQIDDAIDGMQRSIAQRHRDIRRATDSTRLPGHTERLRREENFLKQLNKRRSEL